MAVKQNVTEGHVGPGGPTMSALMFSTGVIGNLIAFLLLEVHRRKEQSRQRHSLFHVLVTALVITDLLGTLFLSPVVLTSYATNTTLLKMRNGVVVCRYFGFIMTFFGLATLAILLAMALERWISIGCPYFYERHITKRCGYISIALILIVSVCFSVLPLMDIGEVIQYSPGTWCFFDMNPKMVKHKVYANLYATLMLVIILSVVLCNVSVICHLILMYRKRKINQGSTIRRKKRHKRSLSMSEEVEHMILLMFMTVAIVVCSLPVVMRVYLYSLSLGAVDFLTDVGALRSLSVNSIIDPLVFIILSPSVLRFLWGSVCNRRRPSRLFPDTDVGGRPGPSSRNSSMELNKLQVVPWVQ